MQFKRDEADATMSTLSLPTQQHLINRLYDQGPDTWMAVARCLEIKTGRIHCLADRIGTSDVDAFVSSVGSILRTRFCWALRQHNFDEIANDLQNGVLETMPDFTGPTMYTFSLPAQAQLAIDFTQLAKSFKDKNDKYVWIGVARFSGIKPGYISVEAQRKKCSNVQQLASSVVNKCIPRSHFCWALRNQQLHEIARKLETGLLETT